MRILALDPGGTTGWATYSDEVPELERKFDYGQIGPEEHHLDLWSLMEEFNPDVVVDERFDYQRRELDKGVSLVLVSREYIGVAKLWVDLKNYEVDKLLLDTKGTKKHVLSQTSYKKFMSDQKLQQLNLWPTGKKHAADAMRHLLYYCMVTTDIGKEWYKYLKP